MSAVYTPAPGEKKLGPNEFTAGSDLEIVCDVEGNSGGVMYSWSVRDNSSTPECTATECNIDVSSTTSTLTVGRPPLLSYYAGKYTCSASETDRPNSDSSDEFVVIVVGKQYSLRCSYVEVKSPGAGVYAVSSNATVSSGPIANNGLIVSSSTELKLECASNSGQSGVGNIITPTGSIMPRGDGSVWILTNPHHRPGLLRLRTQSILQPLTASLQGIYTCTISDSNGRDISINVGLYPPNFNSMFFYHATIVKQIYLLPYRTTKHSISDLPPRESNSGLHLHLISSY